LFILTKISNYLKGGLMKSEKFDRLVKARANERVQEKIREFKESCGYAFQKLTNQRSYVVSDYEMSDFAKAVFAILVSKNNSKNWPRELWEKEEEKVERELLSIMDEMQKALIAADKNETGENIPKTED